jgi:TPR repeat protein
MALAKYYGRDFSGPDPGLSEITGTGTTTVDAALAVLPVSADQRELSTDNRHSEMPTRPAQQSSKRQILADTQYDIALNTADAAQAVQWLQRAADGGHAGAQFELGGFYEAGDGVPIDIAEAVKRYRLAADAGWADAQDMLGWCYKDGTGVEADAAEAVRWFRMAADAGDANAQVDLGQCYEEGTGVAADLSHAIELYRRAAAAGDNNAKACCSRLGVQLL